MEKILKRNFRGNTVIFQDKVRLAKIVFSLSTITLSAKFFGFAEKFVIAHFFGTGDTADVYFASTSIILSIIWLVRELLYPSLLPVFADSLSKSTSVSGNLFRRVFLAAAIFLALIAIILAGFPIFLTKIFVLGFSASKRMLTANLLRLLAPAVFLLSLAMVTYIILNARKNFLKAACPQAALKLFIVIGLLMFVPVLGIYALALVMCLGGLGCLLVQLYFIPERRFLLKRERDDDDEKHFKRILLLMGPLLIGVIFSRISGIVDNVLASTLPSGHLSYLGYSKKLIDAILLIGPVALVTVVYSHLSHLASTKEYEKFTDLVIQAFRLLLYLSVPIACLLIGLRQPLIRLLFQHGEFSVESTLGTSRAFMVYTLGLTTFSLEILLVHSFFALSDTKTPVKYGILCVFLDIALAIALLRPFGHLGIAGAFVFSKTIKVILLATILNRRLKRLFCLGMVIFSTKIAVTACTVWMVLNILLRIDNPDSLLYTFTLDLLLPGISALLAFVLCSYLLRINEFSAIVSLLRYRKAAVRSLYGGTK